MNTSSNQFGLVVAYLLPGFIALAGIAPLVPVVAAWLQPGTYSEASVGPPIYAILLATLLGMFASSVRWLVIDHIHHWTGLAQPLWDDSRLEGRLNAFNYLVESHYRYYQFVANALVALLFAYAINRSLGTWSAFGVGSDIGVFVMSVALFAASRDALKKYYARTNKLIGGVAQSPRNPREDQPTAKIAK